MINIFIYILKLVYCCHAAKLMSDVRIIPYYIVQQPLNGNIPGIAKVIKAAFVLISNTLLAHLLDCTRHRHHSVHFSYLYLKPRERVKSTSASGLTQSPYLCVHGESESCSGMSTAAILAHCLSLTTTTLFSQWFP